MVQQLSYRKNENFKGGTSYPEQFLLRSLRQIYMVEHRKKEQELGLEFDIGIEALNLRIEYSGDYWHIGKEENDKKRREYCKDNKISYIEIIASQGKKKTTIYRQNLYTRIYVYMENSFEKRNNKLIAILKYILREYGHNIMEIDIERAICEAFVFCKQYDYIIVRKNGKIVGTVDKVYDNSAEIIDYPRKNIEYHENEDGIIIKNGISNDIDKNNIKMKIIESDDTLIKTMSKLEFNRRCKRIMDNWSMYED